MFETEPAKITQSGLAFFMASTAARTKSGYSRAY